MTPQNDVQAIRHVVVEYLEGMIYGQDERLRESMHPLCMQAGHLGGVYEFVTRDEFIAAIAHEARQAPGTPVRFDIPLIDITGDIAIAKVTDDCFGSTWTDYLTLIRHEGQWRIVMKAYYDHAND